jgi:hypothetical protein
MARAGVDFVRAILRGRTLPTPPSNETNLCESNPSSIRERKLYTQGEDAPG